MLQPTLGGARSPGFEPIQAARTGRTPEVLEAWKGRGQRWAWPGGHEVGWVPQSEGKRMGARRLGVEPKGGRGLTNRRLGGPYPDREAAPVPAVAARL